MAVLEESFETYKEFHEHFMMNHNGTSLLESAVFISPPPAALLLWSVALPAIRNYLAVGYDSIGVFISEFLILVLPLVFTYTIFSDYILVVSATLLTLWATFVIRSLVWNSARNHDESWLEVDVVGYHRPFITLFRSYTNVITCLCILAVDFRVFPRRFAKTEVSGYGLMDTGTGLFVIANALVTYKPPDEDDLFSVFREVRSSATLVGLGSIRFIAVRLLNYHTHASEYGRHWNFFLTLAFTRLMGSSMLSYFGSDTILSVGAQFVGLAVGHQLVLSVSGLREWVMAENNHRLGFVSSNREGIVSLVGYLALHLAGALISLRIWGVHRPKIGQWLWLWLELTFVSLVFWGATHYLHGVTGVSRRVADLGYICWIMAFSLSSLALFLAVELTISALHFFCDSSPIATNDSSDSSGVEEVEEDDEGSLIDEDYVVPLLLQAVNLNGLAYFIVGNLMTGAVNLCLQTLHIGTTFSIIIIILYMLFLCGFVCILYDMEIKLKLW